ncbi:uncharacterized protein LOC110428775 [Herrania umbratica]|uniref:Uncharacterized protein LOC110428775 n=1 Tax=Herrania umbratica TaxID=108875 RepID=A0A6J1BMN4_9ROSI|nr:uncharacterized protein LOC110428775 [Herrania umbratica]
MEFEQLHMKCDVHEPKGQTIALYLGGLNVEIVDIVQLQSYWNLNDVIGLALEVEKQLSRKGSVSSSRLKDSTSNCERQSLTTFSPPKYFKYKKFRDIASDCPIERIISLVEEEVMEEPNMEEVDDEREIFNNEKIEEVSTHHGEALIVRRNLNTAIMTEDESWLCYNIFYTRCTSQRKVCNVNIDSRSYENVVANYMVEKLKLPTNVHLHPYKLQCLRKGNEVKVMKHCFVHFSNGNKYEDEV